MDYFEEQDGEAVNPSTEPTIGEVISRRTLLKGMAAERRVRLVRPNERLRHRGQRDRRASVHRGAALHRRQASRAAGL